jgi:hypothetical protein
MTFLRFYLLTIVIVVLSPLVSSAQKTLIGRKILECPTEYLEAPYRELGAYVQEKKTGALGNTWVAYSDRDNNVSYQEGKDGAATKEILRFKQPFFVIEANEGYVHIVEYNTKAYNKSTKKIESELKDYGWVPQNKMLLWHRSMIDVKTKFARKCLAVNSLESLNNIEEYARGENLLLYNEPKKGKENGADVRLYNFLYVYKEEGQYLLIGKGMSFTPNSSDVLLGWVNKNIIQVWSQRQALEPNGGPAGIDRKQRGIDIKVYTSERDALDFQQKGAGMKSGIEIPFKDYHEKPYPAEWKRFPIITPPKDGAGVIHTGVISKVFNENGDAVMEIDEQYEVAKQYEEIRKKKSNINVVFVVDGSQSMAKFRKSVTKAIRNSVIMLNDIQGGDTKRAEAFEFGAVVYRNPLEAKCGSEEVVKLDLTHNEQEVIRMLEEEDAREFCGPNSPYSSLNKAMDAALDLLRKPSQIDQTNIIVLIGGEGYNPEDVTITKDAIVSKIAKSRCSLMCFQTQNNGAQAYGAFQKQVEYYMRQSAISIKGTYDKDTKGSVSEIGFENDVNDMEMLKLNCPAASPLPGVFLWTQENQSMDIDRLKSQIEDVIQVTIDNNQHIFAVADSKVVGMGERYTMDEATLNFLSQMKVNKDLLMKTSDKNIQLFIEGYTPKKLAGSEYDLYKYVILLEDTEFGSMIDDFRALMAENADAELYRELITNAYKSMVLSMFGRKEAKDIIEKSEVSEINRLLNGLEGTRGSRLLDFKLADLPDMSADKILSIRDHFVDALSKLSEFRNDPNKSFLSGGLKYYWVPQEMLP